MIRNVFRVAQKAVEAFPRNLQQVRTSANVFNDDPDNGEESQDYDNAATKRQSKERSVNKVTLLGRVGNDPKCTDKLSTFSLATNERYYNRAIEDYVVRTDWHKIHVGLPRLKDTVDRNVKKGDRLMVSGKIHYNKFTPRETGEEVTFTNILVDEIIFLGNRRGFADEEEY